MAENLDRVSICELELDQSKATQFRDAIENSYWFELFIGTSCIQVGSMKLLHYNLLIFSICITKGGFCSSLRLSPLLYYVFVLLHHYQFWFLTTLWWHFSLNFVAIGWSIHFRWFTSMGYVFISILYHNISFASKIQFLLLICFCFQKKCFYV